jgi:hypothetical protein
VTRSGLSNGGGVRSAETEGKNQAGDSGRTSHRKSHQTAAATGSSWSTGARDSPVPKKKTFEETRTTAKSAAARRHVQRRTEPPNRESGAHDFFTGSRNLICEELRSQECLG